MRGGKGPEISFASNYSEKMDFAMWRCERNTIVRPTISPNPLREILITLSGTKYQRKSRHHIRARLLMKLARKIQFYLRCTESNSDRLVPPYFHVFYTLYYLSITKRIIPDQKRYSTWYSSGNGFHQPFRYSSRIETRISCNLTRLTLPKFMR